MDKSTLQVPRGDQLTTDYHFAHGSLGSQSRHGSRKGMQRSEAKGTTNPIRLSGTDSSLEDVASAPTLEPGKLGALKA